MQHQHRLARRIADRRVAHPHLWHDLAGMKVKFSMTYSLVFGSGSPPPTRARNGDQRRRNQRAARCSPHPHLYLPSWLVCAQANALLPLSKPFAWFDRRVPIRWHRPSDITRPARSIQRLRISKINLRHRSRRRCRALPAALSSPLDRTRSAADAWRTGVSGQADRGRAARVAHGANILRARGAGG